MGISLLKTSQLNQNGYNRNKLTLENIGALIVYPINHTPDNCLSCDGYALKKVDYEELYSIIGNEFNSGNEPNDEFRIPDYNLTERFLQPSSFVAQKKEAGLPNITGSFSCRTTNNISGCFTSTYNYNGQAYWGGVNNDAYYVKTFNASLSSSIYGNSTTVQPSAQTVHLCIKYK